jgi:hypothetical protein
MLAALFLTLLSGGNYVWKFARSLGEEDGSPNS